MTKMFSTFALTAILAFSYSCENRRVETISIEIKEFHSDIIDDEFELFYLFPKDYSSSSSYPLIVFLDGNWYYEFFRDEVNKLVESGQIPPAILVGIGYPQDGGYKELCPHCTDDEDDILIPRFRDYTYPTIDRWTIPTGQGDKYAAFLNEELLPYLEKKLAFDQNKVFLMGHSLGGLSTFYNMFTYSNPKFAGYAALSASLYWGEGYTFQLEEEYSLRHSNLNTKLYIAYGTAESGSLAVHNAEMIERIKNRNYPSLNLKAEVFKGASHRQVSWEGFREGMIFLLNN